jgi:hypothetical protein
VDDEFDVKEELEILIKSAKDLQKSLNHFSQYENPRAFDSKQRLISTCYYLADELKEFADNYTNL